MLLLLLLVQSKTLQHLLYLLHNPNSKQASLYVHTWTGSSAFRKFSLPPFTTNFSFLKLNIFILNNTR